MGVGESVFRFDLILGEQPFALATAIDDKTAPDIAVEVDFDPAQNNGATLRIWVDQHAAKALHPSMLKPYSI